MDRAKEALTIKLTTISDLVSLLNWVTSYFIINGEGRFMMKTIQASYNAGVHDIR